MSNAKQVGILCIGLLLGWIAARSLPSKSPMKTDAAAGPAPALNCPPPSHRAASVGESLVQGGARAESPPRGEEAAQVLARLSKLKITEINRLCLEAEDGFLRESVSSRAKYISELDKPERDAALDEWDRQVAAAGTESVYWKANFTLNLGADVLSMDLLLDLDSQNEAANRCAAWSIYYEINGRPVSGSSYGMSSCDGGGFRKKGDQFFYSMETYRDPQLGKSLAVLMIPLPGTGVPAEMLDAAGSWSSLGQFGWQRSSREEFLQMQNRFTHRFEQLRDASP